MQFLDFWLFWVRFLPFTDLDEASCTRKTFSDEHYNEIKDFCKYHDNSDKKMLSQTATYLSDIQISLLLLLCLQRIKSVFFPTSVMIWHCAGHICFMLLTDEVFVIQTTKESV